ncbi:MAG: hypothetical protein GKR87_16730 [Kiritimatiellae bacterium]|nr:hypothetical protein [Kiritimatiellia bacterium]NKB22805.1 hypothetical protein [Kiritimatiellia bacterium]NKB25961.1 hypothetical protein [Kiritimatiellia bacterium]NKB25970.1 hypothetical protein [Kiritimatiellia bacterium]NKB25979.1 hypothetical protein [Kiritimatiellia bacterium]
MARAQVVTTAVLQISAEVVEGTGTYLEVSPTNYTFSVNPFFPTPTDHRVDFNSGTATYFVANGPWSIEVVSDNTNNVDGLATSSGDVLSMKFNTPNLGASDSESDTNWVGDTATFRPVVDNDNLAPLHLADSAGDDRSPTPFTFAADALGGVATNYKSIIEFRLVIE